ncbi:MAG: hypothetical protein ABIK65_02680 [Candidatus Eisenbacteria bacterium]
MKSIVKVMVRAGLFVALVAATSAFATEGNPIAASDDHEPGVATNTFSVTGYTDHGVWLADVTGSTTMIPFESYPSGTQITTQLADRCITNVTGYSPYIGGPTGVYVTSSGSLPFPMFTAGLLPTEPNFLSNDMSAGGGYATGSTTFDMAGPTTAIGAYVADSSPLGGFSIEVFSGGGSVGMITVPDRYLPDSFVGIVSTVPFDQATFSAVSTVDSWGLDNVEHNCTDGTSTESSTWGSVKGLFR